MRALLGLMFITFGVVLLARTWGKIIMDNQHYKRRANNCDPYGAPRVERLPDGALRWTAEHEQGNVYAEGISTVMEDQTEEWHQYVPPEK